MNRTSFFTQIIMIVIAVAIVILYIQPKISAIRSTQDLINSYEEETDNVSRVNEDLKIKISEIDAVSPADIKALSRYLPDKIDEIAVLKDITAMIELAKVEVYDVSYTGAVQITAEEGGIAVHELGNVTEHAFSVKMESNYSQLKSILAFMETNDYLLQVSSLKVSDSAEGGLQVEMNLSAFTRMEASEPVAVDSSEVTQI